MNSRSNPHPGAREIHAWGIFVSKFGASSAKFELEIIHLNDQDVRALSLLAFVLKRSDTGFADKVPAQLSLIKR